ncbi:MAG TPA: flagellar basal body P-ring formation chaperone FlgA [Rhizomicrobium sp.]|jgi:flagella basal body P-ring formation protein FlgA|nr:flagellar basal body P-ring formation chaperone FlgA [Rhizomicrobium sp.]
MKRFLIAATLALTLPADANFFLAAPAHASAAGVRIVVPVHDIARGETISDADLTTVLVDTASVMPGVTTSIDALSGMQTRRTLRAGESVRADDVRHPVIVVKGQTVTMIFSVPGVELTAMGRAMSEGGVGDTVTIQNPASYRMITATVSGPGTVRANGGIAAPLTRLSSR